MPSRNDWPDLIGHLVLLKQQIDGLDPDGPRTLIREHGNMKHDHAPPGELLGGGDQLFIPELPPSWGFSCRG
jgi:hypothetical protein